MWLLHCFSAQPQTVNGCKLSLKTWSNIGTLGPSTIVGVGDATCPDTLVPSYRCQATSAARGIRSISLTNEKGLSQLKGQPWCGGY